MIDLEPGDEETIRQTASLLVEGFKENWPDAWPNVDAALKEVRESFGEGRMSRVAVDEEGGAVLGWIGAISSYDGNVWELHPLVVDPAHWKRGIGRALIADLEERAREAGVLTMYLGTDDQTGMTSLAGVDLYPGVLDHAREIRNVRGHPFEFYQRCGYEIVGLLPDANGFGKPDIFMAKRLQGGRDG
ncbi:MAG TPA: GNAT family N-acetyltransferase [Chloroflexota bacterium]|nr:GNAT family N-acetyltransferase [Chloroflexota bacterium]